MISVICWKWVAPSGNRMFTSAHVNVLRAMVERNYQLPHRFICVTDDVHGLDRRVEAFPMPKTKFEHLLNPHLFRARKHKVQNKYFPSCYRRLWMFSDEARVLGDRLLCIDVDVVVCGDLTPLLSHTASFVGWCDPKFSWNKVAGGVYLLTAAAHTEVWTEFNPETSPQIAAAAGKQGSDQAWMSYKLFPPAQSWSSKDGVAKINWFGHGQQRTPVGARLVFTGGHCPPWDPQVQRRYPWIKAHWRP